MNEKYKYVIWISKIYHTCYVEAKLPLDVKWTDVMILVYIKECSQNYIKDPLSRPKFLQWITGMFKDDTKIANVFSKKKKFVDSVHWQNVLCRLLVCESSQFSFTDVCVNIFFKSDPCQLAPSVPLFLQGSLWVSGSQKSKKYKMKISQNLWVSFGCMAKLWSLPDVFLQPQIISFYFKTGSSYVQSNNEIQ